MDELMCSCVILNYNDAETTIKLVNQIKSYACLRHIIVVDNCSKDNSWEALNEIRAVPHVITIRAEKNGGYGYGNNLGVRYAYEMLKERNVLIVNPDVEFSEDCLRACIGELECSEDVAVVSPVQLDRNGVRTAQYAWDIPSGLRLLLANEFLARHTFCPHPCADVDMDAERVRIDCVPGSFLLVDAEKFLSVGGYNEEMFLYYEEMTLGNRLRRKGWKTVLLPKQTYHHMHSVSVNKSIPKIVSQRKIQHQSLLLYLKDACGYGTVKLALAGIFLKICLAEDLAVARIKEIRERHR